MVGIDTDIITIIPNERRVGISRYNLAGLHGFRIFSMVFPISTKHLNARILTIWLTSKDKITFICDTEIMLDKIRSTVNGLGWRGQI